MTDRHTITVTGPNGSFSATYSRDDWLDGKAKAEAGLLFRLAGIEEKGKA